LLSYGVGNVNESDVEMAATFNGTDVISIECIKLNSSGILIRNNVVIMVTGNLNREDAMDRGRWKKLIKIG